MSGRQYSLALEQGLLMGYGLELYLLEFHLLVV